MIIIFPLYTAYDIIIDLSNYTLDEDLGDESIIS